MFRVAERQKRYCQINCQISASVSVLKPQTIQLHSSTKINVDELALYLRLLTEVQILLLLPQQVVRFQTSGHLTGQRRFIQIWDRSHSGYGSSSSLVKAGGIGGNLTGGRVQPRLTVVHAVHRQSWGGISVHTACRSRQPLQDLLNRKWRIRSLWSCEHRLVERADVCGVPLERAHLLTCDQLLLLRPRLPLTVAVWRLYREVALHAAE